MPRRPAMTFYENTVIVQHVHAECASKTTRVKCCERAKQISPLRAKIKTVSITFISSICIRYVIRIRIAGCCYLRPSWGWGPLAGRLRPRLRPLVRPRRTIQRTFCPPVRYSRVQSIAFARQRCDYITYYNARHRCAKIKKNSKRVFEYISFWTGFDRPYNCVHRHTHALIFWYVYQT